MNNFHELFTVEGDIDYFYSFRFDERNKSFDNLPSHLASKLIHAYDFTGCSSRDIEYSSEEENENVETSALITIVFDWLNDLENEMDVKQRFLSVNANFNGEMREIIQIEKPTFISLEPYLYIFKNLTYQECFQLVLIDGDCRVNTFRRSQDDEARIFRDIVWNLLWGLNLRYSCYDDLDLQELEGLGIDPEKILEHHCQIVQQKVGSFIASSADSWIVANGLKSVLKVAKGRITTWAEQNPDAYYIPDFTDADLMEVLELIRLIKRLAKEHFKKRFEIPDPNFESR